MKSYDCHCVFTNLIQSLKENITYETHIDDLSG